jgi:hypothetical protein
MDQSVFADKMSQGLNVHSFESTQDSTRPRLGMPPWKPVAIEAILSSSSGRLRRSFEGITSRPE